MTEADILQAISSLIGCAPEVRESVIECIRNTEQYREFMETFDNTEDVIEKLKEMLQEVVEKRPRTEPKFVVLEGQPLTATATISRAELRVGQVIPKAPWPW